jgi:hypothetical protein
MQTWIGIVTALVMWAESLMAGDYVTLRRVISVIESPGSSRYEYGMRQEVWERAALFTRLRELDIDLSARTMLRFYDYQLTITPLNLGGDAPTLYILDVVRGCFQLPADCLPTRFATYSGAYRELLVVRQRAPGDFERIDTLLPWLSDEFHYSTAQSGSIQPIGARDVTGDSVDEWLVVAREWSGFQLTDARLFVLGWRDGALVDLAAEPLIFEDYWNDDLEFSLAELWRFEADPVPHIIARHPFEDNFQCVQGHIIGHVWTGEAFVPTFATKGRSASTAFQCLVRDAEAAMYAHDFDRAITFYERALALEQQADYSDYTALRLAVAYVLNGETERGLILVSNTKGRHYDAAIKVEVADYAAALLPDDAPWPTARQFCLRAHRFFVENPLYLVGWVGIIAGVLDERRIILQFPPPDPPNAAGCDVDWLLDRDLAEARFPVGDAPSAQLERLGWPVGRTYRADLDGDGADEWLTWIDSPGVRPILWTSGDEGFYRVMRVP